MKIFKIFYAVIVPNFVKMILQSFNLKSIFLPYSKNLITYFNKILELFLECYFDNSDNHQDGPISFDLYTLAF